MEKVIVTGAGGLLGSKLVKTPFEEYEVIPAHNSPLGHPDQLLMDVADGEAVFKVVREVAPDLIVHAAAATNVDRCETNKDWAWGINAIGTKNIAVACAEVGAKMVYISTDYVFDGLKGLYREEDTSNPVNHYGLTKLQGEKYVQEFCQGYIIARTSVVYGWNPRKMNFATWIINSLENQQKIAVVHDHYNSPTLADDLADIIRRMLASNAVGTYHAAGRERVSRYEFALEIAEEFELDRSLVDPVKMVDLENWIAKRPRDSSLDTRKLEKIGIRPLDLTGGLKKMRETRV